MRCNHARCPREALPGFKSCEICRDKQRVHKAAYYQRKRATGECIDCQEPAKAGRVLCAEHLKSRAEKTAKRTGSKVGLRGQQVDEFDISYQPRLTKKDLRLLKAGRCKCGLLNPCHSCGPTIDELAGSHKDAA